MRLTDRTDYALRVLMLLAASGGRHTVGQMAGAFGVSANHLNKAVQQLQRCGWVVTTPGRGGGVELATDADRLCVGDVVRAIEPDLHLVECHRIGGACPIVGPCRLGGVLHDARAAFLATLDGVTLRDLVRKRESRLVRTVFSSIRVEKSTASGPGGRRSTVLRDGAS